MQSSKLSVASVKKNFQKYIFVFKIVLPILLFGLLIRQFDIRFSYLDWQYSIKNAAFLPIILSFFLLFANISLDAMRWNSLNHNQIGFFESVKQVCISFASQILAPMLLADWLAKVGAQQADTIKERNYNWFINNTIQTLIHSLAGFAALVYFWDKFEDKFSVSPRWLLLFGLLKLVLVIIFWVLAFHEKIIPKISKNRLHSAKNHVFKPRAIILSLVLAIFRFFVYSTQLALLLYAFGLDWPVEKLIFACWLVFFAKSVTVAMGLVIDLGVRQISALWILGSLGVLPASIVWAISLIWLFNLCLPALPGFWWIRELPVWNKTKKPVFRT